MKVDSQKLIEQLAAIALSDLKAVEEFPLLDTNLLNRKPAPKAWSMLECLEHLNRYSSFYLPALEKHLQTNNTSANSIFKSGIIGNYLVKTVVPDTATKKMKTFSEMDPAGSKLDNKVLDTFLQNQQKLLKIVEIASQYDLNKGKIPVTFTKFVKLKLGDTLRFMVFHNQRHILQAKRIATNR